MSQKGRADNLTYRSVIVAFVLAERKAAGAATDLFKLARQAKTVDEWEAQCQVEEEWLLSEEAGQMKCIELPKAWTQARSDIRGAFRAGLELNKIPSYYKMKIAKAEANKAKREPKAEAVVLDVSTDKPEKIQPGEVVILGADAKPKRPRAVGTRDERGPRIDGVVTVEQALANGDVLDAKSNVVMPEDMRELVVALNKLSEHGRARVIKQATKMARDMHSQQRQADKRGGKQHAAS